MQSAQVFFFCQSTDRWCSLHKNGRQQKEVKRPCLSLLLDQVSLLNVKETAALFRFLLDTEEGRAAKSVLDQTYRVIFDGYIRGKSILPLNANLQSLINSFLEMNGTQLLSYNEFSQFAEEFAQGTKGWYPIGFPLNLWAHFLSHSKLIVMAPLLIKQEKKCQIYDSTGDCALVHFEEARKQYKEFNDLPNDVVIKIELKVKPVLNLCLEYWPQETLRCILEYAIKEDVGFFIE